VSPPLDVLIAGAGPVGLTLAGAMAREGVACRVVDQARERPTGTRCPVLWPATLTDLTLAGLGVAELVAGSVPVVRKVFHLRGDSFGHGLAEPASPWPTPVCVGQDRLERALRDSVRGLGVPIGSGVRVAHVEQRPDAVAVTLDESGRRNVVLARYVVLALGDTPDAATLAGVARPEHRYAGYRTLQADGRIERGRLPEDEEHIFLAGQSHVGFVPLPGDRHRVFATLPAGRVGAARTVVTRISGVEVEWLEPLWTVQPRSAIADTFRAGRCFLVGESAKSTPQPVHGLNSGIQDAANLAWKLAAVINGRAPATLLDSYDRERRPTAQALLAKTARIFSYGTSSDVDGALRDRVRQRQHDVRNQPEVGYASGPLTLASDAASGVGGRMPDVAVNVDGQATTVYGVLVAGRWTLLVCDGGGLPTEPGPWLDVRPVRPSAGGLPALCLVRPDGYVAAAVERSEASRLEAFLTEIFSPAPAEGVAACR
jgi:6-methylpretetramide 4-monooxygenase / 4-hydroxy-6-methylpretetramide 12a-monooxygenase